MLKLSKKSQNCQKFNDCHKRQTLSKMSKIEKKWQNCHKDEIITLKFVKKVNNWNLSRKSKYCKKTIKICQRSQKLLKKKSKIVEKVKNCQKSIICKTSWKLWKKQDLSKKMISVKGGVFSKVKMKSRNGHDFKETANVSNFVEIVLVSCWDQIQTIAAEHTF